MRFNQPRPGMCKKARDVLKGIREVRKCQKDPKICVYIKSLSETFNVTISIVFISSTFDASTILFANS
jgi:hypothetical protein